MARRGALPDARALDGTNKDLWLYKMNAALQRFHIRFTDISVCEFGK